MIKLKLPHISRRALLVIAPAIVGVGVFGLVIHAHAAAPPPHKAAVHTVAITKTATPPTTATKPNTTTTPQPAVTTPITTPVTSKPAVTSAPKPQPVVTPSPSSSVSSLTPATPSTTTSTSTGSSTPPASSPQTTTGYSSTNWAGYLSTGGTYTTISGAWAAPHVSGNGTSTSADATWIGIGGVTSGDLIQVGTDNIVSASGQVTTSAFYEMLPAVSQTVPGMTVTPGDSLSASLSEVSASQWTITITDLTNGQSYTNTVTYSSSNSSAEWIEEDPSTSRNRLIPFDDFGEASFTSGLTTLSGSSVNVADSSALPITMVNNQDQPIATPSAIGSDGASFTVTWDPTS